MENKIDTWEELQEALLHIDTARPDDMGWRIYRYLKAHYTEMTSQEARTLLLCYMKIPCQRPSLLHSCILALALRMKEQFSDFRIIDFIRYWNGGEQFSVSLLRPDDAQRVQKDGKSFPALTEKLAHCYMAELLLNPANRLPDALHGEALRTAQQLGYVGTRPMIAVKMFESERDGKKQRSVKLIGHDGEEMLSDWRVFHEKPWEICGRMYDVLLRKSQQSGTERIVAIVPSHSKAEEIFPVVTGYVDRYDATHQHYHIFDNQSRHFVAEAPRIAVSQGQYVSFCPIIPRQDKFKSALVITVMGQQQGRESFGMHSVTIKSCNEEKGYYTYSVDDVTVDNSKPHDEQIEPTGLLFYNEAKARYNAGNQFAATIYLRRCSDGKKRNHIADVQD